MKIFTKSIVTLIVALFPLIGFSSHHIIDSLTYEINAEKDKETIAELQLELAWQKKYEDVIASIQLAKNAINVLENAKNEEAVAVGYSYLGVLMYLSDSLPNAIEYLTLSKDYFEATENNHRLTRVYNNIGICYAALYENKKALYYYQKCIDIKEQNPETSDISSNLINISTIYFDEGDFKKCIAINEQALISTLRHNDLSATAVVYSNLGAAHERLGNYSQSINYGLKALSIYQNDLENQTAVIRTYSNLGSTYLAQGMLDKARYYFSLALELTPNTRANSMNAVALNNLAELERISGNYELAFSYSLRALEIVTKINYIEEKLTTLRILSSIAEDQKHFDQAFFYYKEYINISDSLMEEEQTAKTLLALSQHQLSIDKIRKDKEFAVNKLVSKKINSMIGAFWFFVTLTLLWILSYYHWIKTPTWTVKILNYFLPLFSADLIIMYLYLQTNIPQTVSPMILLLLLLAPILLSGALHLYLTKIAYKKQ